MQSGESGERGRQAENAADQPQLSDDELRRIVIPQRGWTANSADRQAALRVVREAMGRNALPKAVDIASVTATGTSSQVAKKIYELTKMYIREKGVSEALIRVFEYLDWADRHPKRAREIYVRLNPSAAASEERLRLNEKAGFKILTPLQQRIGLVLLRERENLERQDIDLERYPLSGKRFLRIVAEQAAITIKTLEEQLEAVGGPEHLMEITRTRGNTSESAPGA
ncbi:hypothetical protein HY968_04245 [Candidatus Kaiserbacteria bacterium]|nr:hypothetical protein [Candidatus Kaiserbacteria bacterium]